MRRVFSNGPSKDYVIKPFQAMAQKASRIHVAAPYVTKTDDLVEAARAGKFVDLLVGLNASTSPQALTAAQGIPNLAVRYLTRRFHAKIYMFDDTAMVGSSNLTDGGLMSNREATICFDQPEDGNAIEELRSLFLELWDSALVLTPEKLREFTTAYASIKRSGPDPDVLIEQAVGKAEPVNINVASAAKSRQASVPGRAPQTGIRAIPACLHRSDQPPSGRQLPARRA
ncbi:phospholipase D family protein [Methylocystis iwaonis]|uniref:phospholipase D family protein n=1 Tax=Methylocystis iwaonis TaxID=2885079 RepID=UPI002490D8A2|nr:phospholipase D family protein [Methylocystis iwaonis]